MKTSTRIFPWLCGVAAVLAAALLSAKPPAAARKDTPGPGPAAAASAPPGDPAEGLALARWLVQADGGPDAMMLPFAQVVRAATGKTVLPFDSANPADAAALSKIGTALDALLPRMNRPESPAHAAASAGDAAAVAACFEDELRAALGAAAPQAGETFAGRSYPAFSLADPAGAKTYYLATALYPSGNDPTGGALTFAPIAGSSRIPADGCCLLVGIEYNGKRGREMAFLNWQVLDLGRLKVRFHPVFEASRHDAFQPGAVLTDGRKGRD